MLAVIVDTVSAAELQCRKINKALIDIRLRPGVAITAERDVIHKPKVHNISQRRPGRTEPRPQAICTKNLVKIGPAVPEICSRTDRQTDKLMAILCNRTVGVL